MEQWGAGPNDYRRGEDELEPGGTDAGHVEDNERDGGNERKPEAPAHVGQFGISLWLGSRCERFEGHPTDRTGPSSNLAHLRVHRTGIDGARLKGFGSGFRGKVFRRVGRELFAAAVAAEMVGGPGVGVAVRRGCGIDLHAADGVGDERVLRP